MENNKLCKFVVDMRYDERYMYEVLVFIIILCYVFMKYVNDEVKKKIWNEKYLMIIKTWVKCEERLVSLNKHGLTKYILILNFSLFGCVLMVFE